eukprot:TRINITY_DN3233_c0_g1_i1.p1 TRINITY_DN3233_c0_g1~~TRINITY_DN3233_c0_g1_i1.p1  ORF type:complete len:179 (-),score=47.46 TRINITY_DN3233_c0_g1_i1:458-994(-)
MCIRDSIYNFGKDNSAGPGAGWNLTTIRNATSTVHIQQVLYGRQLDIQPRPTALTYLAHAPEGTELTILTHYISTSGDSGFDQLLTIDIDPGMRAMLRSAWPVVLTIPSRPDAYQTRLTFDESTVGLLHVYDNTTGLPREVEVRLKVGLDYYAGKSDGFAGFGTMCPDEGPRSPALCL